MLRQAQAGNFLGKAFCDGFRDIKELPKDGPAEFQFFVNSLYKIWTESREYPFNCDGLKVPQKLELYAFAHKYACHDFQNAIISSIYNFEPWNDWKSAICRQDLERLVADVPDGSPMHALIGDWLIKDMFNVRPEVNYITDEFLEGLPEFLVRAALRHMLTHNFPRSPNKKMTLKMKDKGNYLLPEDSQVRERIRVPPADVQDLLAGDADNTDPCPRPPAGSWGHASAPPASQTISGDETKDLDGQTANDNIGRPSKRRRLLGDYSD